MGLLRLFLALSVVTAHAASPIFGIPAAPAFFSVNVFFIVSGFYMSMVLNNKYRDVGIGTFYKNRVVRLLPVYLIGTIFGLVVTFGAVATFFGTLSRWGPIFFIATNLGLVGQDLSYLLCVPASHDACAYPVSMTINPPAWSLSVELGFYAVAPFIVKSPRRTYFFIAAGIAYLIATNFIQIPTGPIPRLGIKTAFDFNYYFYPASFLFFGVGAMAYQLSSGLARFRYLPAVLLVVGAAFTRTTMSFWFPFVLAIAVPALFALTKSNRIDRTIGELSYPVYILHFPVIDALHAYLPAKSWLLTPAVFGSFLGLILIALALLVHFTVETAATRFRHSLIHHEPQPPGLSLRAKLTSRAFLAAYFSIPVVVLSWVFVQQAVPSA